MLPQVVQAMSEASKHFVDLSELQRQVGKRIATLTQNEAAYITSGAAAGIVLATVACVTLGEQGLSYQFPHLEGLRNEIIVHKGKYEVVLSTARR